MAKKNHSAAKGAAPGQKVVTVNRKARHDYFIEEAIEAGIVLVGSEVKALREGKAQLKDGYCRPAQRRALAQQYAYQRIHPILPFRTRPHTFTEATPPSPRIDRLAGKIKEKASRWSPCDSTSRTVGRKPRSASGAARSSTTSVRRSRNEK